MTRSIRRSFEGKAVGDSLVELVEQEGEVECIYRVFHVVVSGFL